MMELVTALTPRAVAALAICVEKLGQNTPYAFLEAEPHAKEASDCATRALSACQEAELTLRKVDQLSHRLPKQTTPSAGPIIDSLMTAILGDSKLKGEFVGGGVLLLITLCLTYSVIDALGNKSLPSDKRIGGAIGVGVVAVVFGIGFMSCVVGIIRGVRKSILEGVEKGNIRDINGFNWRAANVPQTAAAADETLFQVNQRKAAGSRDNSSLGIL